MKDLKWQPRIYRDDAALSWPYGLVECLKKPARAAAPSCLQLIWWEQWLEKVENVWLDVGVAEVLGEKDVESGDGGEE